jgi:hypothetical protein
MKRYVILFQKDQKAREVRRERWVPLDHQECLERRGQEANGARG